MYSIYIINVKYLVSSLLESEQKQNNRLQERKQCGNCSVAWCERMVVFSSFHGPPKVNLSHMGLSLSDFWVIECHKLIIWHHKFHELRDLLVNNF